MDTFFEQLRSLMPWVGLFLLFLSITKLLQTFFLVLIALKKREVLATPTREQIVIWFALAYILTAIIFFAS